MARQVDIEATQRVALFICTPEAHDTEKRQARGHTQRYVGDIMDAARDDLIQYMRPCFVEDVEVRGRPLGFPHGELEGRTLFQHTHDRVAAREETTGNSVADPEHFEPAQLLCCERW
jgi:hypothetical protein